MTHGDWLDDLLRPAPVADDGFTARVVAVDRGRRSARRIAAFAALAVVVGLVACLMVFFEVSLGEMERTVGAGDTDASAFLAANREAWFGAAEALDGHPVLARRTGRDAAPVIDAGVARNRASAACRKAIVSRREFGDGGQVDPARASPLSTCDTDFLRGIAAYDQWSGTFNGNVLYTMTERTDRDLAFIELVGLAQLHLRRASTGEAGAPSFAEAARDIEGLARLTLGFTHEGVLLLRLVDAERQVAEARGLVGDHTPVIGAAALRRIEFLRATAWVFATPAATADDRARLGALRSSIVCGAVANDTLAMIRRYGTDDDERRATIDAPGCGTAPVPVPADHLCRRPGLRCELFVAPLELPGLRGRVTSILARSVAETRYAFAHLKDGDP